MVLTYSKKPNIGESVHDFSLPSTDGRTYSPSDFVGKKGLVIVFTCNHCPYAQAVKPRIHNLYERFKDKGVQFLAINPNDEVHHPEDSFEKMKEEKYDYPFPYLRDESQAVAKEYGAVCTPDIFVYDSEQKLFYHGRVDDNWKEPEKVTRHELQEALEALIAGKNPQAEQHPSVGCSIKWKV